jgi:mono/diheme cytochrome c family protein
MRWNDLLLCRDRHDGPLSLMVSLAVLAVVMSRSEGGERMPTGSEAETAADPAGIEFFEKSVRPILAARCQGCHGPAKQKGGLRLDARAALIAGGSTGPAVVPGNPEESLLVDAINYGETYQMPPKSKLPDQEIATLTEWVRRGAPWGVETRTDPAFPATNRPAAKSDKLPEGEFQKRARFWSFQPVRHIAPPNVSAARRDWTRNPIDRFIHATLAEHGLSPAPQADRRTLIRRLSFDLTGLPPTPQEVAAFLVDSAPDAYERLVDRLLASPHHGERWARHWLDLVRYAESAGHEFDYDILNAFRYRDYVIRALNTDVPYNRFVTEQIAGDLLEPPRRHPSEGFNESILGTGFYFLGEGTHSPVDVREEQMRRIDNQIDVISKTFLGLTLACARCHDHKFDPITNNDYYALAGFLRSSRHQQAFIDRPQRIGEKAQRLQLLENTIAAVLAEGGVVVAAARPMASEPRSPAGGRDELVFEDFNRDSFDGWFVTGDAFGDRPSRKGDLRLDLANGASRVVSIPPGLAHSGLISNRLQGVLRSRSFTIEARYIHWLVAGQGGRINVVVDGYEKIRDPIYGGLTRRIDVGEQPRWVTQDVGIWLGHSAYLEISDGANVDFDGANAQMDDGHGRIAVDEIRMSNRPAPVHSGNDGAYHAGVTTAVELNLGAVIADLTKTGHAQLANRLAAAIGEVRAIETQLAEPTLGLAIADGTGGDEHIHVRGSHKNLGEVVPRRFLAVLGGADSSTHDAGSGRLELARRLVDPSANPLTPRVLVNRLWKHHFGEGIVRTTDDFGAMGRKPSHPELLDWLAAEFVDRGWSVKAMHRLMVTSSTYRMASVPQDDAERLDPTNALLHRMNVRRLEAEAIRDSLLAVSGRLEAAMYGPSVPVHLTSFMEGRGRPGRSGPLDGDGRRSLYLNVRRNFLNPMLLAFDMPVPFSTMGRRNVSNVPAQALTLMNDPMVVSQARLWVKRVISGPGPSARARLEELYETAFSRPPTDKEARACLTFVASQREARRISKSQDEDAEVLAWTDLCHVLINMKEFIFID